jgi:hypothetical protein
MNTLSPIRSCAEVRRRIAPLRAGIETRRQCAARIKIDREPRVKAMNRLLNDFALREAATSRQDVIP